MLTPLIRLAERAPSPNVSTNLSSNNPFRNRAVSPANGTIPSPSLGLNFDRPTSTNPFLDSSEIPSSSAPASTSAMAVPNRRGSPTKPALTGNTAELFVCVHSRYRTVHIHFYPRSGIRMPTIYSLRYKVANANKLLQEALSFDDKPKGFDVPPPRARVENVPPRLAAPPGYSRVPPPGHKQAGSREEERRRTGAKPRPKEEDLDIFADQSSPSRRREPHARRNSESSVVDRSSKLLDPAEDEKRRRERRKEREARHRAKGKASRRLDVIDKLDVTSIYGMGCKYWSIPKFHCLLTYVPVVHHDGPFDACNPHRNRKGSRAAPMQAFAKDSKNMSLGGSGPLRSKIDLAQFNGTEVEGYRDFSQSAAVDEYADPLKRPLNGRGDNFNPIERVEPLHGDESVGLGTSTFLEGAPASRAAILRRESEQEAAQVVQGGGLSRKKSLAQKIRGNINNRIPGPRVQSPEERTTSPTSPMSGEGPKAGEGNSYFKDYDEEYDKKGAQIQVAEQGDKTRVRAPSSPRRGLGLERRVTNDSVGVGGSGEESKSGGGFLSRVKSMRGGRRMRPERRETST